MTVSVSNLAPSQQDQYIARLACLGIVLSVVEAYFPSPLPGVKPGLANLVTLLALEKLGWRAAVAVNLIRVVASALWLGSLFTPGFFLALSGACGSLLLLGIAQYLPKPWFGLISLSLFSAAGHLAAQCLLAWLWLLPSQGLLYFLPFLALSAWCTAIVNGWLCQRFLDPHHAPTS